MKTTPYMEKKRVYLTDITLHVRERRQTPSFSHAAKEGRSYSPLLLTDMKGSGDSKDGTFEFPFVLPPDLEEQVTRGEVELMMPTGGLLVYAAKDTHEYVQAKARKKKRQERYIPGSSTWHRGKTT